MSIIGLKDLDHQLADFLLDNDLRNLQIVNKYYIRIYDDAFYRRRFYNYILSLKTIKEINEMNIYKESWKKFYYLVKKLVENSDHISSLRMCIDEDRVDILSLMFIINNFTSEGTIYGWAHPKHEMINPIGYCITKDSVKCFEYLYKIKNNDIDLNYCHAHKIKEYLYQENSRDGTDNVREIFQSFFNRCETCYNLIKYIDVDKIIGELYWRVDHVELISEYSMYNKAFHLFVKSIPHSKLLEYKNEAIEIYRLDITKLLTKYSSPFSEYSL
jgi:hypothetical protein